MSVPVTSRIVNAQGDTVLERTDLVDASRFDEARAADYVLDLPTMKLGPGNYLLT